MKSEERLKKKDWNTQNCFYGKVSVLNTIPPVSLSPEVEIGLNKNGNGWKVCMSCCQIWKAFVHCLTYLNFWLCRLISAVWDKPSTQKRYILGKYNFVTSL